MRAVVLVGGFGTRAPRPLTLHTPKQMLPVVHRPMIERVVEHLARHGVTEAVLALGYRPDAFQAAYPDGRCAGVSLHYAIEPEPRDTAGAIRFAATRRRHRRAVPRAQRRRPHRPRPRRAASPPTSAPAPRAPSPSTASTTRRPSASSPPTTTGRVTAFIEKPPRDEAPTDLINAGTYVLEPSVLDRIEPDVPVNVERVTFPAMVADGSLYALDGDTYWLDAGTPATYLAANLDLINGRRGAAKPGVHPDAEVDGAVAGAVVGPRRPGGRRRHRVRLGGAPGCGRSAPAPLVQDAIIGARARVGDGAVVDGGAVLGDDVVVEPGDEVHGARIPEDS